MEQSPSREANRFSASQEIPHILWNPKVHYSIHNSPTHVPVLSQINPVHIIPSCFLKIHPIYAQVFQAVLSLRSPHQTPVNICLPLYVLHAPPISFLPIYQQYWVSSIDHWAPQYVVFSTSFLPRPS